MYTFIKLQQMRLHFFERRRALDLHTGLALIIFELSRARLLDERIKCDKTIRAGLRRMLGARYQSPHDAAPEKQAQRIEAAADVLKKLDPDILLLQEMRDYDGCSDC